MTNLASNLVSSARRNPDRVAVRLDDETISYGELNQLAAQVSGWLAEFGVEPGDRVALMVPNVLAFPVLYYGILRSGAVVVPMNPLLREREIAHHLSDSGAGVCFVASEIADVARAGAGATGAVIVAVDGNARAKIGQWPSNVDVAERDDDDTAVILYTSGTTGTPKGAELTHANLRRNVESTIDLMEVTCDDVIMGCLPLFHAFGQTCGLNTAVTAGASLTLVARFDPAAVLKVIERDRVTLFEGVPTMYVALLAAGPTVADTTTLRMCSSGGAALPASVLAGFAETFGAAILEGYGLSETSPVASFNHPGDTRANSIGKPIRGIEMRVVDDNGNEVPTGQVGEITVKGHNVMKGYWQRPDATAAAIKNGWFHTGDIGRKDDDGFFYVVDRKKELIIRGGFNVYPREIEEVLYEHPGILEAAVIGIPHPTHGEEVAAAVAVKPGASYTADEIRDFVRERVAAYKYPRQVWILDELPKGPTGKILKREIALPDLR